MTSTIKARLSSERGHADHGWLNTYHTFSFADYHDPDYMSFGPLRVLNEDRVTPGKGFGTHAHRDMEILTWVVSGTLAHRDSMGSAKTLSPGEAQMISAGTGITHSEFNASPTDPVHFLQIWIMPEERGLTPEYQQLTFPVEGRQNRLQAIAAYNPQDGAMKLHQDAAVYACRLTPGAVVKYPLVSGRTAWVQVVTGTLKIESKSLSAGDGAAILNAELIELATDSEAEVLLFDLPPR